MSTRSLEAAGRALLHLIVERKLIQVWPGDNSEGWTLRSRLWSPFYVDLRGLCSTRGSRKILEDVGDAFAELIRERAPKTTRLVAVATAGIPIATAVTMRTGIPTCYTRREQKRHEPDGEIQNPYGQTKFIEGEVVNGDHLLLIDDLVTDGTSKIEALTAVDAEARRLEIKLDCHDAAVIMDRGTIGDRGTPGDTRLKQFGVRLHSLIPLNSAGLEWLAEKLPESRVAIIREYLSDPAPFQRPESRAVIARRLSG